MLISPDNPETEYLSKRVIVLNEFNEEQGRVFSFDTLTKEAELFVLTEDRKVKVEDNKIVLEKKICPGWKVIDKYTKKEIL